VIITNPSKDLEEYWSKMISLKQQQQAKQQLQVCLSTLLLS
jgi:hypothetical protein